MTAIALDKKHWLSTSHFLKIHEGKLVFWDYKLHCQFELTIEHLSRLIEFSTGSSARNTVLDQEINQAGVLTERPENSIWQWDWLAHIFHYGTCHPLPPEIGLTDQTAFDYTKSYTDFCASISDREPEVELIKGGLQISLPAPNLEFFRSLSLWEALATRRTCRDFNGSAISLADVADLLFVTFGDQRAPDPSIPSNVRTYGFRRTSPSAGGLQCTEPYLWAINVDGLPPGIYHYLSRQHKLEIVTEGAPPHPIGTYLCNQNWANDLSFAIFMTCRMEKMWWKYPHSRAYRPMLMDVGHLSQTLNLCIASKKLHPWMTGYFHDSEIANILQCTPESEHPILVVGAGHGSGSSLSKESRKLFTGSIVEK